MTNGHDLKSTDLLESVTYSLHFIKFSMDYEKLHSGAGSTSKYSPMLPDTFKSLLTTDNNDSHLKNVEMLISYLTYYKLVSSQALISSEILTHLLHQPGVNCLISKLGENEHLLPVQNENYVRNDSNIIATAQMSIDKLLTNILNSSHCSTESNISIDYSVKSIDELFSNTNTNELTVAINNLINHFVNNKTSLHELQQIARMLNLMPEARITLPTTIFLLMKEMESKCHFDCATYVFCKKCNLDHSFLPMNVNVKYVAGN